MTDRGPLRCRLGIHRWQHYALLLFTVIDMGERAKRCERCGKVKRA